MGSSSMVKPLAVKRPISAVFSVPWLPGANINHIRILKDCSSALLIMINHESIAERER